MNSKFCLAVTSATLPPPGLYPCRCAIRGYHIERAALSVQHRLDGYLEVCILQDYMAGGRPRDVRILEKSGFTRSWKLLVRPASAGLYTTLEEVMAGESVSNLTLVYPVCPEGGAP